MPNEQRVPGHRKGAEDMTIKEISEKYHITADTLRYYERVGMIPPVTRAASGIRDYGPKDESWVSLAICMRRAGLPVEAMIEYVKLFQQGDKTIPARLQLLVEQRELLEEQQRQIEETRKRLNYKISRYEEAMKTGKLTWEENEGCHTNFITQQESCSEQDS